MKKRRLFPVLVTFAAAAAAAVGAATLAVDQIEVRSLAAIEAELDRAGLDWASVTADGLRIEMAGTAPDEATRFRALGAAGSVVDGSRVIDRMEVAYSEPVAPPRFSIEILRASEGVTLIGLVPASTDRQALVDEIASRVDGLPVADLLEVARHDAPETWSDALGFGLDALARSDKAKVSIAPDRVAVTTMAPAAEARAELVKALRRAAPEGVEIALDITAPRPVIAPFVLRLTRSSGQTDIVACSAPDEAGRDRILKAAGNLGADEASCRIGLGAPSPDWSAAAVAALDVMRRVEDGVLTMSNLDIRIEAGAEVADFAKAVAELDRALPTEFTLSATQADAETVAAEAGPAEFIATRSPEGLVQMRGVVGSERSRKVVDSFSRALFGDAQLDAEIEIASDLPAGWSPRVLAALDGLSILDHGAATLDADSVRISGTSGNRDASSDLAQLFSGRLGKEARYDIDVRYDERLDREAAIPTPQECVDRVNAILSERQITFDPGSSTIAPESRDSVEAIGAVLAECDGVRMEVGGHTDSQGREEMNRDLSQTRAEAVLTALLAQRVPVGDLTAMGYGESNPVADNATAAGREANRRIEFRLLEDEAEPDTGAEPAEPAPEAADEPAEE